MATNKQPVDLIVDGTVKIDATITAQDLAEVFVVQHEDELLDEKHRVQLLLSADRREHEVAAEQLREIATTLVAGYKDETADALAASLAAFTEQTYEVRVALTELDIAARVFKFDVIVARTDASKRTKSASGFYGTSYDDLSKDAELPFTEEMLVIVARLEVLTANMCSLQTQLNEVARKLVDLPRTTRRAKATITMAALKGELGDGAALLERIGQAAGPRALPHLQ